MAKSQIRIIQVLYILKYLGDLLCVIIQQVESVSLCPKVITLSGFHCILDTQMMELLLFLFYRMTNADPREEAEVRAQTVRQIRSLFSPKMSSLQELRRKLKRNLSITNVMFLQ